MNILNVAHSKKALFSETGLCINNGMNWVSIQPITYSISANIIMMNKKYIIIGYLNQYEWNMEPKKKDREKAIMKYTTRKRENIENYHGKRT